MIRWCPKQRPRCYRTCHRISTPAGHSRRYHDDAPRVAVIGAGPAGFYSSGRILNSLPSARIDMYESLPVPFGLVRYGVAPDHPEVKNCQDRFEQIAQSDRFTFRGNVSVGSDKRTPYQGNVKLSTLRNHYHAIILAYGASQDRLLGIPGESMLSGIYSARQFVGWYNGSPEHVDLAPNLTQGDEAVIIGHGNVALDVARILLTHVDGLRQTDIAEEALAVLAASRIKRVHIVGRRGPMQASFTVKEVRELMRLPNVHFHGVHDEILATNDIGLPRTMKRLRDLLRAGSESSDMASNPLEHKSWSLDFCLAPRGFLASNTSPERVYSSRFERVSLTSTLDTQSTIQPMGEFIEIPSSSVFRSIGYKSSPLAGFREAGLSWDDRRGVMLHDGYGRAVAIGEDCSLQAKPVSGVYCTGWVKTGPTGVIASTLHDAFATADALVQDWTRGQLSEGSIISPKRGWSGVIEDTASLATTRVVSWNDWGVIDKVERSRGAERGKLREKFKDNWEILGLLG